MVSNKVVRVIMVMVMIAACNGSVGCGGDDSSDDGSDDTLMMVSIT